MAIDEKICTTGRLDGVREVRPNDKGSEPIERQKDPGDLPGRGGRKLEKRVGKVLFNTCKLVRVNGDKL